MFDFIDHYYLHLAFGPTFILTHIFSCLLISLIFNHLEKKWKCVLRIFLDFLVTYLVYLLFCSLDFYLSEKWRFDGSQSRFYIPFFLSLIHSFYPRKNKYLARFTSVLLVASFISIAVSFSGAVGFMISSTPVSDVYKDTTLYLVFLLMGGTVVLLKKLDFSSFKCLSVKATVLLDITFVLTFAIHILANIYIGGESLFFAILLSLLYFVDIAAYLTFYFNANNYNIVMESQATALKLEVQNQQLAMTREKYDELHQIRHDIQNQFAIIEKLAEEKNYGEMDKYLKNLSDKVHIATDFIECGNDIVNVVLNMENSKAKGLGIKIDFKIVVPPKLPFDATDITSLFTNLLDNAIEAEQRDKCTDVIINCEVRIKGSYLFSNS
jgi:sensor histidine kinase YesM